MSRNFLVNYRASYCAPTLSAGGFELATKFPKKGGLTRPQLFEGVAGKEGSTFFQGRGCNFQIKNKLKTEIFNDKKSL